MRNPSASIRVGFAGENKNRGSKRRKRGRGNEIGRRTLRRGGERGAENAKGAAAGPRRRARLRELVVPAELRKGSLVGADPPGGERGREEYGFFF